MQTQENEVLREAVRSCLPCPFQPWHHFLGIPSLLQSLTAAPPKCDSSNIWQLIISISWPQSPLVCLQSMDHLLFVLVCDVTDFFIYQSLRGERAMWKCELSSMRFYFLFCGSAHFAWINLRGSLAWIFQTLDPHVIQGTFSTALGLLDMILLEGDIL